ncbi:hypothetical protein [Sphingorhabdus sp. Alg239-R122]|uniref:hypothetical protein n=1 Tax=Sphingorhabdus sp. Alg239-R122 TaxID=2305989 RepID=UPI0013DBEC4F|nr:hypothetical protein [Sphingorhabdus sp. Alg239-R122]
MGIWKYAITGAAKSTMAAAQMPDFKPHPFLTFDTAKNYTVDVELADVDGDLDILAAHGRHYRGQ